MHSLSVIQPNGYIIADNVMSRHFLGGAIRSWSSPSHRLSFVRHCYSGLRRRNVAIVPEVTTDPGYVGSRRIRPYVSKANTWTACIEPMRVRYLLSPVPSIE